MDTLLLLGVISAGSGVALVLGQMVLTMVIHYQLLADSYYNRPARYNYQVNYVREFMDISLFLQFVNETKNEELWHILRRKRFKTEVILRQVGNCFEVVGGGIICYALFGFGEVPQLAVTVFAVCALCLAAYSVNFVMLFIVAKISEIFFCKFYRFE